MASVEDALKENNWIGPGFNILRHLLAVLILAHHCRVAVFGLFANAELVKDTSQPGMAIFAPKIVPADSYEHLKGAGLAALGKLTRGELVVELARPGLYALVGMFFILSGFLVAGSAIRKNHVPSFITNRILRIVPALGVEVTLCALVLGPLYTNLDIGTYFGSYQFYRYFGNVVGHITFELPGVFLTNPWPEMVNANLWTLPWELWCYVFMVFLMIAGVINVKDQYRKIISIAVPLIVLTIALADVFIPGSFSVRHDTTRFAGWYIVLLFILGVYMRLIADLLPLRLGLFIVCGLLYYILALSNFLGPLSGLFLAYCTVYIGMMRFDWFDRLMPYDLSYGIYLYGFPITQAVVAALIGYFNGPRVYGFVVVLPTVVLATALFAYLSWIYIERPALRLRRLYSKAA